MTSHVGAMVLFAFFVSVVFATISRDTPAEQIRLGVRMFAGFVGAGLALGWLLFPLPI
ncbi:MAG: hypothetical protein AB1635_02755 [Acidobacteriota bacterium]